MEYKLTQLIDSEKINVLVEQFSELVGVPIGIVDNKGNLLGKTKHQDICNNFHLPNSVSGAICINEHIDSLKLIKDKQVIDYICPHGLRKTFYPIIAEEQHIANIFIGIYFNEKADIDYFKSQAIDYGYDIEQYIKAVEKVPVISKERVEKSKNFILKLTEIISDTVLSEINRLKLEALSLKQKEDLENLEKEKTKELLKLNAKLEEDIVILKQTENKLKNSEERYKKLLSMLPYGILIRYDNRVLLANDYAAKFLGFDLTEEVVGKNLEDLFYPHPSYEEEFTNSLKLIDDRGDMNLREERFISKKDGKILDVETAITTIDNSEKNVLVVFRDISERKRIERLKKEVQDKNLKINQTLQYDKLRSEFFSNISHEFKTPINVISAAIQTAVIAIDEENLTNKSKVRSYLDIMKQNSLRLIRLVNNFLDITKIDSGYLSINLENWDIISTVENIVLSVVEYVENKGINLIFDTEIEERVIACDRNNIERIILNLLSNAIKFTPTDGEILVYIKEKNNKIIISVSDTGIGIPLEKQNIIFDRFVQVDKSLSRGQEGSGIGLSLVRSLVEMHNGKIYVDALYTEGSKFVIELPITITEKNNEEKNYRIETKVEKIDVEFSDIYI